MTLSSKWTMLQICINPSVHPTNDVHEVQKLMLVGQTSGTLIYPAKHAKALK
jgi:hypothetical protein